VSVIHIVAEIMLFIGNICWETTLKPKLINENNIKTFHVEYKISTGS
jgi:hypothetical protein